MEEEEEREAAVVVERNKEWRGIEVLLQLCLSQHVEWWLVETTAPQQQDSTDSGLDDEIQSNLMKLNVMS